MRILKRLIVLLLVLLVVFGGVFGLKYRQLQQMAAQGPMQPPPAVIAAAEVTTETWQPFLHAVGSLSAVRGVYVTNEVPGQVKRIAFDSGSRVDEGEVLLQLDDSVDQADLEGLIAERRLAEVQFERAARLFKDRTISAADHDEARARLDFATAQVAAKRASIEKKTIRAPFAGTLGIRQVELGQYLAPGAQIVLLQAVRPIYVDYTLPERHFAALSTGQHVEVQVQAYPGQVFKGHISAINPGIEPGSRSVRLRATLENLDGRLRPGMFAEVRTLLPKRQGVLTLPRTAISYNPYGDTVFVVEERDGQPVAVSRQVRTGEVREGRVEISDGLRAGERVVSAGQNKLRNGMPVQIDDSVQLAPQATKP